MENGSAESHEVWLTGVRFCWVEQWSGRGLAEWSVVQVSPQMFGWVEGGLAMWGGGLARLDRGMA